MAVYKRRYAPYTGSLTPERSRFFVLTRYAFADLFKSRFFVLLLILSLVPSLFFAGYIFIANNKAVQLLLPTGPADMFSVEARFFTFIMMVQTQAAFLLNCWVGPILIAGDLTNGALPLFLSRPLPGRLCSWKARRDGPSSVRYHMGAQLAVIHPAGRAGKGRLDLVAHVDGRSYRVVPCDLDPDAFSHFSGRVGVGQVANCGNRGNIHLIFHFCGPR